MPNSSVRMGSNRSMYDRVLRMPKKPFMPDVIVDTPNNKRVEGKPVRRKKGKT